MAGSIPAGRRAHRRNGEQRGPCRALVPLNSAAVRASFVRRCKRLAADLSRDERKLSEYERVELPAFERWYNAQFWTLQTELRTLAGQLADESRLHQAAENEAEYSGIPLRMAFARVLYWRENPDALEKEMAHREARMEAERKRAGFHGRPLDIEDIPFDEDFGFEDESAFNDAMEDLAREFGFAFGRKGDPAAAREQATRKRSVRDTYRKLCRMLHPDANPDLPRALAGLWHAVQDAYAAGDAERLDALLARAELGAGDVAALPRVSMIADLIRHYRSARKSVRAMLRRYRASPAWGFPALDAVERDRMRVRVHRTLCAEQTGMRESLQSLQLRRERITRVRTAARRTPPEPQVDPLQREFAL
jgi:hypothetical protein